jgi:hypothetical protein
MKLSTKLFPVVVAVLVLCCLTAPFADAQGPTITSIQLDGNGCEFSAGSTGQPCSIGPGMVLQVYGQNFGPAGGGVGLCDCPDSTTLRWTDTHITVTVDTVTPQSVIKVETQGGGYSNTVPYVALAPVITGIQVGTCRYIPNVTHQQCAVTAGASVTILGNYFGRYPEQVATCNCTAATIDSWNPNWLTDPKQFDNAIVITPVDAVCGSSIVVQAGSMWSNPVPYTTCAQ